MQFINISDKAKWAVRQGIKYKVEPGKTISLSQTDIDHAPGSMRFFERVDENVPVVEKEQPVKIKKVTKKPEEPKVDENVQVDDPPEKTEPEEQPKETEPEEVPEKTEKQEDSKEPENKEEPKENVENTPESGRGEPEEKEKKEPEKKEPEKKEPEKKEPEKKETKKEKDKEPKKDD